MVPAQTTVSCQVSGSTSTWIGLTITSIGDVRAALIEALSPSLTVYDVQLVAPGLLSQVAGLEFQWAYTATIVVGTRAAYGSIDDVAAIVAHACYVATGTLPTVTVPDWQGLDQGAAVTETASFVASLGSTLTAAVSHIETSALVLIVALVVVVAVVVNGKQIGAVARAIA